MGTAKPRLRGKPTGYGTGNVCLDKDVGRYFPTDLPVGTPAFMPGEETGLASSQVG
jgi:hypothetical protein